MTQIILLSGGSGKRLWPLSNETRSKQFLPLLSTPSGDKESMVQRVARQIAESGLRCEINLATNLSQRDTIFNQLGEEVGVILEPCRRDTFPAIALASVFLSKAKGCSDDEVVVVMPCDPYTEAGYFEAIAKMQDCVKAGIADLVLMGIKPSYPSEKFGYIIPGEAGEGYHKVERFTEKPDVARAVELLDEGALWNGGVFAFRLGYLLNIVGKYLNVSGYEEMQQRYAELPKISFDYEVVEKADNIAVVTYDGEWKDLGTWNTLSEVLSEPVIGNAKMGEKCHNTHIVNELSTPIYCDGIDDAIIAASPDGILVCNKKLSEGIKDKVNAEDRPMYEVRRWGKYKVLGRDTHGDGYKSLTKSLVIHPGKSISYQMHEHRDEVWTFVDGEALVALDGKVKKVGRGDVVIIKKGQYHAVKAISQIEIIEVQSGDLLEESDIIRVSWSWDE